MKLPTVAGVGPCPWLVLVVSESLPHGPDQLQQLNSAPRSSYSLTKTATGPLCPPGDGVACGPQIFPSLVPRLPNMAQGKVDKAQVPKISPCWPSPNKLLNGPGLGQDGYVDSVVPCRGPLPQRWQCGVDSLCDSETTGGKHKELLWFEWSASTVCVCSRGRGPSPLRTLFRTFLVPSNSHSPCSSAQVSVPGS